MSITPVAALAALVAFLALSIATLLGLSLLARLLRLRREARSERFRSRWEPVLHERMAGGAVPLPALARPELGLFLALWLRMLGYVRDEGADALLKAAEELGMREQVPYLLENGSPAERLLATRAAGAMRLAEAVVALLRKAAERRPHSSLEAAGALLKIDPEQGFAALQDLLAHLQWSPGRMAGLVKAGGERARRLLWTLLATLPPGAGTQVVRLIELMDDPGAAPALRERLLASRDAEEVAAIVHALGRLGGAADRSAILALLAHPGWLVRMQAAAALGSLGLPEDGDQLVPLLRDREWWVRYRAAQALLALRGAEAVRRLRAGEPDGYAREILERALAEG